MGLLEAILPGVAKRRQYNRMMSERYKAEQAYWTHFAESTADWMNDDDENQWQTISQNKENYTPEQLDRLRRKVSQLYYTSPSARGIIEFMVLSIIGKNADIAPYDDNEKVQKFWERWQEENKWDMRAKEIVRRTLRDGEVFIRRFNPKLRSQKYNKIRFIDPDEIKDYMNKHSYGIECDPDDVETVLNYHRSFFRGDIEDHESISASDIIHAKIMVDSNEKRGISFLIGIAKSIRQYDRWLDDRVRLNRLRNLYNLIAKPQGGLTPAQYKSKFEDETRATTATGTSSKKMPKPGSLIIAQGMEYEFKSLNLNAADTQHDGRSIERQICKATHLVEGVVTGDFSNQNYASSLVAESPMVKAIEFWQDFFGGVYKLVFAWAIDYGISCGELPKGTDKGCQPNFSTMVHRDLLQDTQAYQVHKENRWASNKTISAKLGYDYEAEQDEIDKEDEKEEEIARKRDGLPSKNQPNQGDNENGEGSQDKERGKSDSRQESV